MRLDVEGATSLLVLALALLLLWLFVLVEARELDRVAAGSTCRTAREQDVITSGTRSA